MSQEQIAEAEAARQQARLAAEKFEKIYRATEPSPRQLAEAKKVAQQMRRPAFKITKIEQAKPPKPPRIIRVREKRSRRRFGRRPRLFAGPVFQKQGLTHVRLREGTPANISRAEKEKSLRRLDAAIADWSRRYTFRVVHGGTPTEKNEAAVHLRQLNAEKEAIEAMRPLGVPEHIRRAERIES